MKKKTIILGVGNPILGDDGVGIHVADELKKEIKHPDIEIDHAYTGGLNLLDMLIDSDRAIIIDAVKMNDKKPGEVKLFKLDEISSLHGLNPHDISLPEAIKMAKKLGERRIPHDIKILGINLGEHSFEFNERLSPEINKAIPKAVEIIKKEMKKEYE